METVSDIAEEAEYMLVSHNFAPERANQTYFKISVILLSCLHVSVDRCRMCNTQHIFARELVRPQVVQTRSAEGTKKPSLLTPLFFEV